MMQKPTPNSPLPNGTGRITAEPAAPSVATQPGYTPPSTLPTSTTGQPNQGLAEQAKQKAKHTATQVAGQAREQVTTKAESQKERAVDSLGGVATALRQTSEQLRDQQEGPIPQYVQQAADQVERITGYLRSRSVGDLVNDVERFARREPALFLGGAFALGLLGARFLKSSSPETRAATTRLPEWSSTRTTGDEFGTLSSPVVPTDRGPTGQGGMGGY